MTTCARWSPTALPPARSRTGTASRGTDLGTAPGWVMFSTIRVLSGDPPGPPLEDLIADVESPTLLISAATDVEREFNVLYDDAAGGNVEHWNLPDSQHTTRSGPIPRSTSAAWSASSTRRCAD